MVEKEVSTLVMAVERLAENQGDMAKEIKELTRAISKMDVVMEKMVNLETNHKHYYSGIDARIKDLEIAQNAGCPALREAKIQHDSKYEAMVTVLNGNRERIDNISKTLLWVNRLVIGAVIAAVLAGIGLK